MHKRLNSFLLTLILLLAAALRVYWLDGSSLWSDEGNTWALIERSFGQIAWNAAADIHPPGYYWALKVWTSLFGVTAAGMRSFSAFCGIALVYVIYAIGRNVDRDVDRDVDRNDALQRTALLAAFIAALNPFQLYYSQEARMYMLLALESAGLFWALFALMAWMEDFAGLGDWRTWINWPVIGFVLFGIAGLWTHYSFPIILAAALLAYFVDWLRNTRHSSLGTQPLLHFIILNMLITLAFLPWLPTAIERVINWPKGGEAVTLWAGLSLTLQTLLFGPLRDLPSPLWPWLIAAGLLPVVGMIGLRRARIMPGLTIWLLLPIGLMFGLGLFSAAFLKFLLVASPAWVLLVAGSARITRFRTGAEIALAVGALAVALVALPGYYGNPTARDNYAGIARYVEAIGDPARDLVLLNAPGQHEVWRYYAPDIPVLALPDQRPPDRAATEAALAEAVAGRQRVFALYWATDESDPERIVETWLDTHAFKGLDGWQGNVRLVTYNVADDLICTPLDSAPVFGEQIELLESCQPAVEEVAGGEAALIGLRWQALQPLAQRYQMSVQMLDDRGQVAAQQDGEPAGGALPTTDWTVGEPVNDNRGLSIPAGTPPGAYRLIVAVYDPVTGERLAVDGDDFVELGQVTVTNPTVQLPLDILDMQSSLNRPLGPVTLVGYGQHKVGFAHEPTTPIAPGDAVEYVLYWQAPDPLPIDWPVNQEFTLRFGEQEVSMALAGGSFPTADWQAGQLVRVVVQLPYDGGDRRATVGIGESATRLAPLP